MLTPAHNGSNGAALLALWELGTRARDESIMRIVVAGLLVLPTACVTVPSKIVLIVPPADALPREWSNPGATQPGKREWSIPGAG